MKRRTKIIIEKILCLKKCPKRRLSLWKLTLKWPHLILIWHWCKQCYHGSLFLQLFSSCSWHWGTSHIGKILIDWFWVRWLVTLITHIFRINSFPAWHLPWLEWTFFENPDSENIVSNCLVRFSFPSMMFYSGQWFITFWWTIVKTFEDAFGYSYYFAFILAPLPGILISSIKHFTKSKKGIDLNLTTSGSRWKSGENQEKQIKLD